MSAKIFISHSSHDKKLVSHFIDILLKVGLQLKSEDIICSSIGGTDFHAGDDAREKIINGIRESIIFIPLISENYKNSEICLHEMGAAWGVDKIVTPVLVGSVKFSETGWIHTFTHSIKIADGDGLDNLKDALESHLGLPKARTGVWNGAKNKFLEGLVVNLPEKIATKVDKSEYDKLRSESDDISNELVETIQERDRYQKLYEEVSVLKDAEVVKKIEEDNPDPTIKVDYTEEFYELIEEIKAEMQGLPSSLDRLLVYRIYQLVAG